MLVLARDVYDAVIDHAERDVPHEACGVLAGTREGERRIALAAHPMTNVAATPRIRYALDPEALLATVERVESAGHEVVGFYHSHPAGPPGPSRTDHDQATWSDHHYLLVSLSGRSPMLDAWVWTGDRFAPDAVTLRDTADGTGTRRD